ncbi:hypothetical protein [Wolbachia endosymbiont of Pentidionis agamae]|uniref:hypothetical protein n=1 Tax=Wolbachia endosymbiont of Pentidionis agamae TaxID=3110435 RepID=UPI002FD38C51
MSSGYQSDSESLSNSNDFLNTLSSSSTGLFSQEAIEKISQLESKIDDITKLLEKTKWEKKIYNIRLID